MGHFFSSSHLSTLVALFYCCIIRKYLSQIYLTASSSLLKRKFLYITYCIFYLIYCAEDTKAEEGICQNCHVVTARRDAALSEIRSLFFAIYVGSGRILAPVGFECVTQWSEADASFQLGTQNARFSMWHAKMSEFLHFSGCIYMFACADIT